MAGLSRAEPAAGWAAVAARRTGEGHTRRGERGQDALALRQRGAVLVAALADGAGSAARGGAGAALAVRAIAAGAARWLDTEALADLDDATLGGWVMTARARLVAVADARSIPLRDLAATLILCLSDGRTTRLAHVGDGAAVLRDAAGAWRSLSWPAGGEHAGSTYFLTDAEPDLRFARHEGLVTALALFTDGIERLVLDFGAGTPHAPFFDRIVAPLDALRQPGRDAALSRALGAWLGGAGVAARTDDDRTLVLARPLEMAP